MKVKDFSPEQIDRELEKILPGVPKAKDAPPFTVFEERSAGIQQVLDDLMEEESFKRYKAMDRSGNVFKIQNPALLTYQIYLRRSPVKDIIRERVSDRELKQVGKVLPFASIEV